MNSLKDYIDQKDFPHINLNTIKIKYDIPTLNLTIAFIYKDSVLKTRRAVQNIYKLFTNLDKSLYQESPELMARIWIIENTLYAILNEGLESFDSLKTYCLANSECDEFKANILEITSKIKISHEESKFLIRKLDDDLNFGYAEDLKYIVQEEFAKLDDDDSKKYKDVKDRLYKIAIAIINIERNTSSTTSDQTFSLEGDQFENTVEESVKKLKDRNRIFIVGIQWFNMILSPGFMSKRLYIFLAFPGKGKSMILLYIAVAIRKHNLNIQTKDPDKRPAVLLLTLENDVAETIERLYNMTVSADDIRNYTVKQVIVKLRREGQLRLTVDNNMDLIIKEYKNKEIDTDDLYTIINDLGDNGVEVHVLIIDYIKRIRPVDRGDGSEKIELKNISNELKECAKFFDIPIITAQQLNRAGASVVDAALQANKEDVTKLVGRDAIAGSWELLENADFTCVINPETRGDSKEHYLTFKLLKRRYRSTEESPKWKNLDYFSHPFEEGNDARLIEDVDLPKSLSVQSLATDFNKTLSEDKKSNINATEREKKKKKKSTLIEMEEVEFEPFDFDKFNNY